MRIISQNGQYDIPYESVIIQRFTNHIYFLNANLTGVENVVDDISIAEYSSTEKAVKVMEALREAYTHPYIRYFQFPKDEDVKLDEK